MTITVKRECQGTREVNAQKISLDYFKGRNSWEDRTIVISRIQYGSAFKDWLMVNSMLLQKHADIADASLASEATRNHSILWTGIRIYGIVQHH